MAEEDRPSSLLHAHHLSRQLASLHARLQTLESSSKLSRQSHDSLEKSVRSLILNVESLENSITDLNSRLENLETDSEVARSRLIGLQDEIWAANDDVSRYGPRFSHLELQVLSNVAKQEERVTSLQQELEKLQEANRAERNEWTKWQSRVTALEAELAAMRSRGTTMVERRSSQQYEAQETVLLSCSTEQTQPTLPMTSTPKMPSFLQSNTPPPSSPPVDLPLRKQSTKKHTRVQKVAPPSTSTRRRSSRIRKMLEHKQIRGQRHHLKHHDLSLMDQPPVSRTNSLQKVMVLVEAPRHA